MGKTGTVRAVGIGEDRSMDLRFEGPLSGGNYPQCAVLRCASEGAYVATLTPAEGGFPIEKQLCSKHKADIDAGAAWSWDEEQMVFLMGADRTGDGRFIAASYTLSQGMNADSQIDGLPLVLSLTDHDGNDLRVAMSRALAADIGKMLTLFTPESDAGREGGDRDV
jgi:hypothetical protein